MSNTSVIIDVLNELDVYKIEKHRTLSNTIDIAGLTNRLLDASFEFGQTKADGDENNRKHIAQLILKLLRKIKIGISYSFGFLSHDQKITAQVYRSGLQFLVDNFNELAQPTNRKTKAIASLLKISAVDELTDAIFHWSPFLAEDKLPDLTGIPDSHIWWNRNYIDSSLSCDIPEIQ